MQEFKILLVNIDTGATESYTQNAKTKKEIIKIVNATCMNHATNFKAEIAYTIIDLKSNFTVRKGRIVPKITYRYVVDFSY